MRSVYSRGGSGWRLVESDGLVGANREARYRESATTAKGRLTTQMESWDVTEIVGGTEPRIGNRVQFDVMC